MVQTTTTTTTRIPPYYSGKRDLKAYVRYDGTGRLISGSLLLSRIKPKVGNWIETQAYLCCNPTTTSTSTTSTTSTSTSTTTIFIG